jgi:hypothetical protein
MPACAGMTIPSSLAGFLAGFIFAVRGAGLAGE